MKKLILITLVLFTVCVSNGWATPIITFTGQLGDGVGGLLIANDGWLSTGTFLSWTVTEDSSGLWTYHYTFTVPDGSKNISHVLIEVSSNFTSADLKTGTTPPDGTTGGVFPNPQTWEANTNPNQGMPADLFGYKWSLGAFYAYDWTIVTDRAPMWGDFYARDGKDDQIYVWAYNKGFGSDTTAEIGNGNAGGWALVPDTATGKVPEPASMILLGSGLIGCSLFIRRKSKKQTFKETA